MNDQLNRRWPGAAAVVLPVALMACLYLPTQPAWAQSGEQIETVPAELEPALQVTATRQSAPVNETLSATTVISAEDIRISVAQDLLELLRLQPGVDVVRTGGPGSQTSVFLRGANSNQVLVLIDGVRVASANSGAYVWEQLPINQVERIEIVRGPRASLYGSDAIGGVIQIFTRRSPEARLRLTAGSWNTGELAGGIGHRTDRGSLSVNGAYRNTDGFSSQNQNGFSYHPDDDGYDNTSIGLNGSRDSGLGQWAFSLLAIDAETEFDQGISDFRQWIGSASLSRVVSDRWQWQLQAGYVDDELTTDFVFFETGFASDRIDLSWINQLQLGADTRLSMGVDWYGDSGQSDGNYKQDRENLGGFALLEQQLGRQRWLVSGRFDDNSEFGNEWTGQVDWGIDWDQAGALRLGYGTAFRAPSLSEQFSPGFGGFFAGNPDLEPESSKGFEAGYRLPVSGGAVYLNGWRTEIEDLIAFSGPQFGAVNINEARLKGVELGLDWVRGSWSMDVNATLQNTEDTLTGQPLLRRPERKGSVTIQRTLARGGWLGLEWFLSGPRDDFGGQELPGYGILNLRSGLALAGGFTLEARLDNLAGRDYEPAIGFNSAGRSIFVVLDWRAE